jgi:hypothetical protein
MPPKGGKGKEIDMSQGAGRFQGRKRKLGRGAGRTCRGKASYRTHEHAVEALVGIRYRTEGIRGERSEAHIPVRVYQCLEPVCNGRFHLTSRPLREFKLDRELVGV